MTHPAPGRPGSAEFALMLLADARLPVGGHAHSAGLEAALLAGMPAADIPAFLALRLRTSAVVEAATAVVALPLLAGAPGGSAALREVERHWAARTPSPVQRQAAVVLGRGYARLLRALCPQHPATGLLDGLDAPARPLVLAGLAAALGLRADQLARLVCYDEVQTIAAAALKLVPLDPAVPVGWALAVRGDVERVVTEVEGLAGPEEIPAPAAPLMELWAHRHAAESRRLFSA